MDPGGGTLPGDGAKGLVVGEATEALPIPPPIDMPMPEGPWPSSEAGARRLTRTGAAQNAVRAMLIRNSRRESSAMPAIHAIGVPRLLAERVRAGRLGIG